MFNVGDEVEVIEDSPYVITTAGSSGTVVYTTNSRSTVRFSYLKSGRYGGSEGTGPDTYRVDDAYLRLTRKVSKEERVLTKINQMSTRFDKRKKPSSAFEENLHAALYL